MKPNKLLALLGLFAITIGSLFAGFNYTQNGNGTYDTTVSVPSSAVCAQWGGAWTMGYVTNYGPLGSYTAAPWQSFQHQGDIAAGDYRVVLTVVNAGYSGCNITW